MPRPKQILACDCETDPFAYGRKLAPFMWGLYDGKNFNTYQSTGAFVEAIRNRKTIVYAHNGGKFDFMFLLPFVGETRAQIINGRIVSMYLGECELRDSYSIIPEPLRNFGAKKEIEYWKLEEAVRHEHMPEITEYLFYDCKILYDACKAYRAAAGKYKTIASNALAFSKKIGIDPGKTNARFDEKYRLFYFGGRTECFQPGTHRNVKLIDIKSSYPYAMSHDHATGSNFFWRDDFDGMTCEDIQRSFIIVECMSRGAFPKRAKDARGLYFPHEYDEYYVTGWEYLTALELGLIDNIKIQSVRYTKETINFGPYVQHWYAHKSRHSKKDDPINYTIGKIMMNSLYGKLAQNPARYYDYKIVKCGTRICRLPEDDGTGTCKLCNERMKEHGWELENESDHHEIHRRESLWKYQYEYGVEWKAKAIFKNVATGASITGFARAHLLRAIHEIGIGNVIYCDTDGIATTSTADFSTLTIGDALGNWAFDDTDAPIGHFAGKKLYGIQLSEIDPKTGKNKEKIASKGSKLTFQHIEKIIAGETVKWESPAPSFSIDGSYTYIVRNIRATATAVASPETTIEAKE
jgi:DNA polymerase type B, organellar and viral